MAFRPALPLEGILDPVTTTTDPPPVPRNEERLIVLRGVHPGPEMSVIAASATGDVSDQAREDLRLVAQKVIEKEALVPWEQVILYRQEEILMEGPQEDDDLPDVGWDEDAALKAGAEVSMSDVPFATAFEMGEKFVEIKAAMDASPSTAVFYSVPSLMVSKIQEYASRSEGPNYHIAIQGPGQGVVDVYLTLVDTKGEPDATEG